MWSKGACTCVALHHDDTEVTREDRGWSDGVCQKVVGRRILICSLGEGRQGFESEMNIRLGDSPKPAERSFERVRQKDGVEQHRCCRRQGYNLYVYVCTAWLCVHAARKLSVSGGMLLDRLKLILAISGAGVNAGWTPTEPRQAKQAEDRWNHTLQG